MVYRQDTRAVADGGDAAPTEPGLAEFLSNALAIARRQFRPLLIFTALGVAAGILYLMLTPKTFVAEAEILFDRSMRPGVSERTVIADTPFDASFFESQVKILQSDRLALAVVRKLHLTQHPEFSQSGGFFDSLSYYLSRALGRGEPTEAELEQRAAGAFVQKVEAKRSGVTFFIEIRFLSNEATLAEDCLNALAEVYIADQTDARYLAARRGNEWLNERLIELRRQAGADEKAVNSYKAENGIVSAGGVLIGDQALAVLNNELAAARAKTAEASARLNRIEAVLRGDNPNASVDATVSEALSSPIVIKLRQDYLAYVTKITEYSARYGPRHLAVVSLHEKARNTKAAILSELRRLAESSKSDFLIAQNRQQELERQLSLLISQTQSTGRAQVKLRELESATQSSRALYNAFQQKYLESTQEQSSLFDEVRVTKRASATNQRRAPKVLALALIGGLLSGGAFGLFRELVVRVFRTSRQVEQTLRAPCVAIVPVNVENVEANSDTAKAERTAIAPNTIRQTPEMAMVVRSPRSFFTEAIRAIKLSVDFNVKLIAAKNASDTPKATIALTSALQDEGKSTVGAALAQLLAQIGRRVIIVDCDLCNPALSRCLAPGAKKGLVEVLAAECSLTDAVWTDPTTHLAFLPSVPTTQVIDTSEVLASPLIRKLFNRLLDDYDYIVVDLPPLLPVTDVQATSPLVDFYFLVVEWGRTRVDLTQHALSVGKVVYDKLAGVVLNKADLNALGHYDEYSYRKYYDAGVD